MAKSKAQDNKAPHAFRNKLLLNQWLVSLFDIDPLAEQRINGRAVRPFHKLSESIRDSRLEGLDKDNLHYFFHYLAGSPLFSIAGVDVGDLRITRDLLLSYEENIVRHTQGINEKRRRPIFWKYYQWLTLLFVEIYLDRFFGDREQLIRELNCFVGRFNSRRLLPKSGPSCVLGRDSMPFSGAFSPFLLASSPS